MSCYCGSDKSYHQCCGPIIEGSQQAATPEQLMRSRYSAYAQANINYIKKSMCGKASEGFNTSRAKQWAESCTWLGLTVKDTYMDKDDVNIGYVEFEAQLRDATGVEQKLTELSKFRKINNQWFYIEGKTSAKSSDSVYTKHNSASKVGRNDPCPCGSGKKFKKCCYLERETNS